MFEAPLSNVIAIDTDNQAIHFFSSPGDGRKDNHLVANYNTQAFDDEFFEKFNKSLKAYQQKNPAMAMSKVSLVLPDHVFLIDTIDIPAIGKKAMEHSLELAIGAVYKNKNDLKYRTFPMAQNKQFATFGLVGMRKDLATKLADTCNANQISVQNITFAANSMVNGAFVLNPKLKNSTFLLLNIRENGARLAFVNKGRTIGAYSLPFGYSMLYKSRLAAEDLLFDHAGAELLVLNAKERAKAKQLTLMGEEVLTDPDEEQDTNPILLGEDGTIFDTGDREEKKTTRKLPKFMLRETPADREGFVYENFRIFVKWTLDLIASNPAITTLGEIDTVYVNLPKGYEFLYAAVNTEAKENKVKFAPLLAEGTKNLELFGGLYVKQYNKTNNF